MSTKPSFESLPLRPDGPRGNAWGLFGDQDQMGMLNLLTPENTAAASKEIIEGVRVSTDWPLDSMATPCFGRAAFQHAIKNKAPRPVNDDTLIFNTQSSSQWDGFRHYGAKDGAFYNGCSQKDIENSTRNGIHGECTHQSVSESASQRVSRAVAVLVSSSIESTILVLRVLG